MQLWKFAASARIASALMRGSPEPPDLPLQGGALGCAPGVDGGMAPVAPPPCAAAIPVTAAIRTAAMRQLQILLIPVRSLVLALRKPYGCPELVSGTLMV